MVRLTTMGFEVLAYLQDFQTGSGLPAGGQIESLLKNLVVALVFVWVIWVIAAALRSWSAESSDSASLVAILIRGAFMAGFVGLIITLI